MRPALTVASSLTPHLPWWRNVSMPSAMLVRALEMVVRNIGKAAPRSGVAVTIRVPEPRLENTECLCEGCLAVERRRPPNPEPAEVVKFG